MKMRTLFVWLGIAMVLIIVGFGVCTGFTPAAETNKDLIIGTTFSHKYAEEELGLNWPIVFKATIEDLGIRHFRLPAYWDVIEPEPGVYNWSVLDYELRQLEAVDGEAVIAVGRRLPRYPECHVPDWAQELPEAEQQERILRVIELIIDRYKDNSVVTHWQVENEPFLSVFGECPEFDEGFFQREIALVRSLDDRPIMVTDSGELSLWQRTSKYGDILGTSLYRVVWNKYIGFLNHIFTPGHYISKARFLPDTIQDIWISELQLEAWTNRPITELNEEELYRSMDPERMTASIDFAKHTGFSRIYVWGVEWWYYMKEVRGNSEFWDIARALTPTYEKD